MKKIWKDVIGYVGLYQISNYGEVRSLNYIGNRGKILVRSNKTRSLSKDGIKTFISVGKIVAEHFIPNPENKTIILHKDFNDLNNRVSNLRWATNQEISDYMVAKGRIKTGKDSPIYGFKNLNVTGEKHHNCKLTDIQVLSIRRRYNKGETQVSLAKKFGVSQFNISRIVNNKNRTNIL